jgi:hypothetical protein
MRQKAVNVVEIVTVNSEIVNVFYLVQTLNFCLFRLIYLYYSYIYIYTCIYYVYISSAEMMRYRMGQKLCS